MQEKYVNTHETYVNRKKCECVALALADLADWGWLGWLGWLRWLGWLGWLSWLGLDGLVVGVAELAAQVVVVSQRQRKAAPVKQAQREATSDD